MHSEEQDPVEADAEVATEGESEAGADAQDGGPGDTSQSSNDAAVAEGGASDARSVDGGPGHDAAALDASVRDSESGDARALDANGSPEAGAAPDPACQASKVKATAVGTAQIDFVWIVDSSASMFDEQTRLRSALDSFVERVRQSKLDVRVIMVSRTPTLTTPGVPVPGLCPELPPDPLFGHSFASDPRYRFVETDVGSAVALQAAIINYARYAPFLRAGSAVHFLVVTDDEDQYTGGATKFVSDMSSRLGRSFHFHTFSSPGPTPCTPSVCNPDPDAGVCTFLAVDCRAASVGATYYELASLTRGVAASICEIDWKPAFQSIFERAAESTPGACAYPIPSPPQGRFESDKLNLGLIPQASNQEVNLSRVGNSSACGVLESWFYDAANAPTQVHLCPKACARLAAGDSLSFSFGCRTVVQN